MFEYFKEHYKNSNKGIKGRGKGRLVAPRGNMGPRSPVSISSRSQSQEPLMARVPSYTIASSPSNMVGAIPRTHQSGGYAVFEEAGHHGHAASNMMYEEDPRQMAFSDRMY